MTQETGLIDLQKQQVTHDRHHHHDIYTLPHPLRMNHYALHFSKYVGRLSEEYSNEEARQRHLEKTLADSFIVVLASANTLNLDLQEELESTFDATSSTLSKLAQEFGQKIDPVDNGELQQWWFSEYAGPAGEMSNAMESRDHMEPLNVRGVFENQTVEILAILLTAAGNLSVDLEQLIQGRWTEIEEESIL